MSEAPVDNTPPTTETTTAYDPSLRIAEELGLPLSGVRAVARLLAEGATVPFIARYRKEQSQGLDEVAVRAIEEKRGYLLELHERKGVILAEIGRQGKLTKELEAQIRGCFVKSELEDLYLPYRPKRRTRAMIARERGLGPLADLIMQQPPTGRPADAAAAYVDAAKDVPDVAAALRGARDIVAETITERADVRGMVREAMTQTGFVVSRKVEAADGPRTKFETYYDFREPIATIPSHRFLAIRRGETEGVLRASIELDVAPVTSRIAALAGRKASSPFAEELDLALADGLERLLLPSLENDIRVELKMRSDREAVSVFAENLRRLLLAAPLGRRAVLGIDPGQRTGCKCVVVDDTGKYKESALFNLVTGDRSVADARRILSDLLERYRPYAIAIGNGTHGRETLDFCKDVLRGLEFGSGIIAMLVSESGASVYSASDIAREEFPDLDLTVRGAISIARRLQDPLAELVKIDPKAIGVGQYQHDVFQPLLARKLDEVIVSCVNAVGVELNTASAPLLERVSGLGPSTARRIVKTREESGPFHTRRQLLDVAGIGPKTFEQCAGFVRIQDGAHPLDRSAVHPERYELVEQIAKRMGVEVFELLGAEGLLARVPWAEYVTAEVGMPTLEDIRGELLRPGRDPRDAFEAPAFREDIRTLEDLRAGMTLEGVVTNVTAFGAFVDLGVHQDGLVHVSQLADRFVKDPHEVVKVGDRVRATVVEVDLDRKRIALSLRKGAAQGKAAGGHAPNTGKGAEQRASGGPRKEDRAAPGKQGKKAESGSFTNHVFRDLLSKRS